MKYRNFRKQISFNHKSGLEGFLTELAVGIIFSVMAHHAYVSEMVIIAVPLGLLALACLFLVVVTSYAYIRDWISRKENAQ